jgi:uncharacterized protein with PIN domain
MLKFISYKQVTTEMVDILRKSGYEVFYVAGQDEDYDASKVCQKANAEGMILLTGDEELAEGVVAQKQIQSGLLFYRHEGEDALVEAEELMRTVQKNEKDLPYSYSRLVHGKLKQTALEGA